MAEEHQDKFSLPLAGVVALVAMAGAILFDYCFSEFY
jgi:hypothetical protein